MSLSLEPTPARGYPVPSNVPHIVTNSLPDWEDNIALSLGKAEFFTGTSYPRFTIHPFVSQVGGGTFLVAFAHRNLVDGYSCGCVGS
jgi:hypothetical protein